MIEELVEDLVDLEDAETPPPPPPSSSLPPLPPLPPLEILELLFDRDRWDRVFFNEGAGLRGTEVEGRVVAVLGVAVAVG